MQRIAMSSVMAVMACSGDPIPPPPAEAVASCEYSVPTRDKCNRSTIWYDASDRVIRIDGYTLDYDPAPYYFEYDGEGRLVSERGPGRDSRYAYGPDKIEKTGTEGTWVWQLVDGRAVRFAAPLEDPIEKQTIYDYDYDESDRLTKYVQYWQGRVYPYQYTYDAEGRLATVMDGTDTTAVTYTETADQLTVSTSRRGFDHHSWTFTFDDTRRLIRTEVFNQSGTLVETANYTYEAGTIQEDIHSDVINDRILAVGRCDPPDLLINPPTPLPLRAGAPSVRLDDIQSTDRPWQ